MRHYLTEAETTIRAHSDSNHIGLWVDGSDHMQFKCTVCGHMLRMIIAPHISKYGREGGAIYFNLFCKTCNEIHDKKIYFGLAEYDMVFSVEWKPKDDE